MIRRGETSVGLGALDIIAHSLGVLGDGVRVAGDGKFETTPIDGLGSTTSLIHVDWPKSPKLPVYVVDENEI